MVAGMKATTTPATSVTAENITMEHLLRSARACEAAAATLRLMHRRADLGEDGPAELAEAYNEAIAELADTLAIN